MKSKATSITEGNISLALLAYFFPILAGTLFQQLYNTVDAIIVGRFVGKEALAAVGGGTAIFINLLVGFFIGISSGAGVIISQFYGAKNDSETSRTVHTSLMLSLAGGIFMTITGIALSNWVLIITSTPEELMEQSLTYLRIFFVSMVPMFIYNMGSGILRAIGDSRRPLYILIAAVFTNIILDILFVAIFKWGVAGVAWATVASQVESMVIVLIILALSKQSIKFKFSQLRFTPHILAKIWKIGLPAGIQSTFYSVSNLIIQASINSFGTATIAAWATYGKIDAVFWTIVNAMGISITTFSGINYGAEQYTRLKKSMWHSLVISLIFTFSNMGFFWFTGEKIFHMFTSDEEVIRLGMEQMKYLLPVWWTYISIEVLSGIIRGTGDSFIPMMITLFGVCILRVVWLFTAVPVWHSMNTVMASYPITWVITSILFWIYYFSGKWLRIKEKTRNEALKKVIQ